MILYNINITSYKIALKQPLKNSQNTYVSKRGFIIKLEMDSYIGYGDVSPLDNFSKENLQQITWAFEEFKISLIKKTNYDKQDFFNLIKIYCEEIPSLHFAIDIAFYDILSQRSSVSIAKYLNASSLDVVKMSSFFIKGFQSKNKYIKIKLLCKSIESDIQILEKVFGNYSSKTLFRIDFNRGYNLKDAIFMCDFLSQFKIEYIEEPLLKMEVNQLKKLKDKTNVKLAIDESIYSNNFQNLIQSGYIDYAILKPSIYGGVDKILDLNQNLILNNVELVLSSSLENYIGNMAIINLASALKLRAAQGINNFIFYNYNSNLLFNENSQEVNIDNIVGLGVRWDD